MKQEYTSQNINLAIRRCHYLRETYKDNVHIVAHTTYLINCYQKLTIEGTSISDITERITIAHDLLHKLIENEERIRLEQQKNENRCCNLISNLITCMSSMSRNHRPSKSQTVTAYDVEYE